MISDNKLKHSVEVARNCVKLGKEFGLSQSTLDALFVMGFLHDIGYETLDKDHITEHPQRSYEMITNFIQEINNALSAIKRHGRYYDNMSLFDYILNYSDLVTNHIGDNVTISDRLESIKQFHGENSEHYQHSKAQAKALITHKQSNYTAYLGKEYI